jgi:hypothetical protein
VLSILAITGPIYVFIGSAFRGTHWNILRGRHEGARPVCRDLRASGTHVHRALATSIAEILDARYLGTYALGSVVLFLVTGAIALRARRGSLAERADRLWASPFSNSGFIGYPIALQILGPPAAVALAMCMITRTW